MRHFYWWVHSSMVMNNFIKLIWVKRKNTTTSRFLQLFLKMETYILSVCPSNAWNITICYNFQTSCVYRLLLCTCTMHAAQKICWNCTKSKESTDIFRWIISLETVFKKLLPSRYLKCNLCSNFFFVNLISVFSIFFKQCAEASLHVTRLASILLISIFFIVQNYF